MRGLRLAIVWLVLADAAVGQSPSIQSAGWLAGCWALERGQRTTLEMWMPPAGGMMLGASRTVVNGVVREYERIIFTEKDGTLVYIADPSGQSEAAFTSTDVTDSSFTIENPAHDFPQKISYRRIGPDSLAARVDGAGRAFEWRMGRVSCQLSEPVRQ